MPDLCRLDEVKAWLNITNTADDLVLSRLITSTSADFLNEIRRPDIYPAQDWTELRFGNGLSEMYLEHYPLNSVATLTVNGVDYLESIDGIANGFWFNKAEKPENRQKLTLLGAVFIPLYAWGDNSAYLAFGSPGSFANPNFRGPNVLITYNAGYKDTLVTDELATVPAVAPFTVSVAGAQDFASDVGVKYSVGGASLVKVSGVPTVGQYAVNSLGIYTFAAADAALTMKISYNETGLPTMIRQAVIEWVAFRRGQSQMQSQDQSAGAERMGDYELTTAIALDTLKMLDFDMPMSVRRAIAQYRRESVGNG